MTDTSPYPWPLQPGHLFGANVFDLRYHTGRESFTDQQNVARWQRAYMERVSRKELTMTGRFDGATQRAVIHVQTLSGLPVTGTIDPATWVAVWTVQKPQRPTPPVPPEPDITARKLRRTPKAKRTKLYWRRYSRVGVEYGADPDAPPWYPGKPFSMHEEGWHVQQVQELLGLKPTGRFTKELTQRVRGVQRMNDLPVSGIVDAETARVLDPGPW